MKQFLYPVLHDRLAVAGFLLEKLVLRAPSHHGLLPARQILRRWLCTVPLGHSSFLHNYREFKVFSKTLSCHLDKYSIDRASTHRCWSLLVRDVGGDVALPIFSLFLTAPLCLVLWCLLLSIVKTFTLQKR